ncbi:MAG: right-handed parallel beta-helix repeat-containing protein, partial [Armatimonadetes bacterium]|nr:right-handed parallel beta-helix repeat-containing protein [Armatimonadota bacterium]
MMAIRRLTWAALLAAATPAGASATFVVAPNGSDDNPGTRARPFATLERARQAVRERGAARGAHIVIRGGVYERSESLLLGRDDGGSRRTPVVWEAARGETVRLIGGKAVPISEWTPVEDPVVLDRLKPEARPHVRMISAASFGVSAVEPFPTTFHGAPPGPEVFVNDQRMTLARWPNEEWATIARIVQSGSRPRDGDVRGLPGSFEYADDAPSRWSTDFGVWLQGYWCYDWYDEVIKAASIDGSARTITLAAPHVYSLMQGNPSPRRYRAINVLEELDRPGEFAVDAARGTIYLWPPAGADGQATVASTLKAPIISVTGASNIVLRGLTVECGLGNGIEMTEGSDCLVERCEVRNMRLMGVVVRGGMRHRVVACG